ncbi:hypothetical protein ACLI09_14120 [Flavobacterium sp. RHBU_24]|uniref:hypothetical protein n=1 Tax=Flavobacterium sp. RHBU_24 TaxID=3391185 RepID=UPI003985481B
MDEVKQLYYNTFGISFYWVKEGKPLSQRIQVVFRDTGLYLTPEQVVEFAGLIKNCGGSKCASCSMSRYCPKFLLKTPVPEIDLAVDYNEFLQIKDLIDGTLFKIDLFNYLDRACLN